MLSREVMGAVALAILWVNVLLIAGAAIKTALGLRRLGRSFGAVSKGRVLQGQGPEGALAALDIEQVGRLGAGASPTILFHDRARACRIFGGRVATDGSELDLASSNDAEVWIDDANVARISRCPSQSAFDSASTEARKARGYPRSLHIPVSAVEPIWIARNSDGAPLLVSTLAPHAWITKRCTLAYAFVVGDLAIAAACTAAALHAPVFGAVSTAGAAAAFIFFLLVQPVGTALRDALTPPSRAVRHDAWHRPTEPPSRSEVLA